jgi:hypothetical protein
MSRTDSIKDPRSSMGVGGAVIELTNRYIRNAITGRRGGVRVHKNVINDNRGQPSTWPIGRSCRRWSVRPWAPRGSGAMTGMLFVGLDFRDPKENPPLPRQPIRGMSWCRSSLGDRRVPGKHHGDSPRPEEDRLRRICGLTTVLAEIPKRPREWIGKGSRNSGKPARRSRVSRTVPRWRTFDNPNG